LWIACLTLHAFFVLAVALHQTLWVMAQGYTALPQSLLPHWRTAEAVSNAALAQTLSLRNPLRKTINLYINATGIEGGYGFFAPSVPDSYKIVFELRYPDGHVEYELPRVSDAASGVRLATLLDQIGRITYDPLREVMIKMLAYSVWQEHPEASGVRAVFGYVSLPTIDQVKNGSAESYHFLYAYEFSFRERKPEPAH
jgi:hypothetical protein